MQEEELYPIFDLEIVLEEPAQQRRKSSTNNRLKQYSYNEDMIRSPAK
jgi:hypothetical protein